MRKILINIDCGEGFGIYRNEFEEELIKNADLVNIACGFHAGDPDIMRETVKIAKKYNVLVGAHPSYPDLVGFGRRSIKMTPQEIENLVLYQIGALYSILKIEKLCLNHVKPHGALYNDSVKDPKIAEAIGRAVSLFDNNLYLIGLSGSKQVEIWKNMGLKVLNEVYIDRAYNDDGTLVPRSEPHSVISDLKIIEERLINLIKKGEILSINGNSIKLKCETLCLHSDTPHSLEIIKLVRNLLINDIIF
ncbi:MAG: LamB/YcsF family protein [Caldisericia bacterium]|nr:LamB/YcsF family protein [Caldisericia bacterium]